MIGNYNVGTIQNFINACPGNHFKCETYAKQAGYNLIGFEYGEMTYHPNYGYNVLPFIKPIFWNPDSDDLADAGQQQEEVKE